MATQSRRRTLFVFLAILTLALASGLTVSADWSCTTGCEPGWSSCCTFCVDIDGCGDIRQAVVQCD